MMLAVDIDMILDEYTYPHDADGRLACHVVDRILEENNKGSTRDKEEVWERKSQGVDENNGERRRSKAHCAVNS